MKSLSLLGGLTPAAFLAEYWHKRPLLVRQAVPDPQSLPSRDRLFELAAHDDVEARLIVRDRSGWQVDHGPFFTLPSPKRKDWTLLVQGVNLHDGAADALLRRFRFLPDARLDDVMISYAADGGGVGPHFDSYDVFLLQAHGSRRWRIGAQSDLSLVEGAPLKILRGFAPEQEFILEPGDMLYLPPNYAHEGVAIGECTTCSIGFRAPSYQELGEAFLQFMAETIDLPGRYADPDLVPTRHPAQIGKTMLAQVAQE
ncbi:MAG: cupin domain-containing protein, partial [Burkholderiaceae bacterium]